MGVPLWCRGGYCCSFSKSGRGDPITTSFPSGLRSIVGAYWPSSCRRHQNPSRFSGQSVNQYCQITARTSRGGVPWNGSPAKSDSTADEFVSKPLLGGDDKAVLLPVIERSEPEIPVEARLIRSVDAGRCARVLWLVAERVGGPVLAIIRTLEFNLVAGPRHHRKKAITLRDARGFERDTGAHRQAEPRRNHLQQSGRGGIKIPSSGRCAANVRPAQPFAPAATTTRLPRSALSLRHRSAGTAFWFRRPQRQKTPQKLVVEQQKSQNQHQIIQKCIIAGHDDARSATASRSRTARSGRASEETASRPGRVREPE